MQKKLFTIVKHKNLVFRVVLPLLLSWIYALCAQPLIHIFPVPVYLHPLPLFLATYFLGRTAVYAWALYILQGAVGAPFFSLGRSGIAHLCGPTGGYIIGMLVASVFLLMVSSYKKHSILYLFGKITFSNIIVYAFGLLQLSLFVPMEKLFLIGIYPFLIGNILKTVTFLLVVGFAYKKTT